MAKIMLVEDDNNLREIYGARLLAEGYEIVSAQDGEEALALAVKEKPDLIISDVMMPRISGFDMLDILRNAPETKNTKVIMMTALSQAEDKSRADKLGADRYLVKSQVTLEDVANVVHEVLEGDSSQTTSSVPVSDTTTASTDSVSSEPAPASETPETPKAPEEPPIVTDAPADTPSSTIPVTSLPEPEDTPPPASDPAPAPDPAAPVPEPVTNAAPIHEEPAPEIPDTIETATEPTPTPTVESIANPPATVEGESAESPVETPPVQSVATSIPVIDHSDDSTSDASSIDDTSTQATSASTDAPTSIASTPAADPPDPAEEDLPPVVEPVDPASIKVELPSDSNQTPTTDQPSSSAAASQPAVTPTPSAETPKEEKPQPDEAVTSTGQSIGPTLAEALAAEEQSSGQSPPSEGAAPEHPISEMPGVTGISNGAPLDNVITPTETASTDPEPAEEAEPPKTAPELESLGKKVIQPINDPLETPDLEALLAAEERKAAVENPVASTVVTPGEIAEEPKTIPAATKETAVKPSDDPNSIAI